MKEKLFEKKMFYLFVYTIADINYVQIYCDLEEIATLKKKYLPLNLKNHAVCIELFPRWAMCNISK